MFDLDYDNDLREKNAILHITCAQLMVRDSMFHI